MTEILPFKVTFPERLPLHEWGDLSRVSSEDLDDLVYAELLFEEQYNNPRTFCTFQIGDASYIFYIWDIFFIWEDLPELLCASMAPSGHQRIVFDFVEQGTEMELVVTERDETTIYLSVLEWESVQYRFFAEHNMHLDGLVQLRRVPVDKRNFVQEWMAFAEKVMQILVTQDFIAANNPAVADYFARIPSL